MSDERRPSRREAREDRFGRDREEDWGLQPAQPSMSFGEYLGQLFGSLFGGGQKRSGQSTYQRKTTHGEPGRHLSEDETLRRFAGDALPSRSQQARASFKDMRMPILIALGILLVVIAVLNILPSTATPGSGSGRTFSTLPSAEIAPTATPPSLPTSTPVPPTPCFQFVSTESLKQYDYKEKDGKPSKVGPNSVLNPSPRIQVKNCGKKSWPSSVTAVWVDTGSGSYELTLPQTTPGGTAMISLSVRTPATYGPYTLMYSFQVGGENVVDETGKPFSAEIHLEVVSP